MSMNINPAHLAAWTENHLPGALQQAMGKGCESLANKYLATMLIAELEISTIPYSDVEIQKIIEITLDLIATRKRPISKAGKYLIAFKVAADFRNKHKPWGMIPDIKEVTPDLSAPSCATQEQKKSMLERMITGFRTKMSMLRIHNS